MPEKIIIQIFLMNPSLRLTYLTEAITEKKLFSWNLRHLWIWVEKALYYWKTFINSRRMTS